MNKNFFKRKKRNSSVQNLRINSEIWNLISFVSLQVTDLRNFSGIAFQGLQLCEGTLTQLLPRSPQNRGKDGRDQGLHVLPSSFGDHLSTG